MSEAATAVGRLAECVRTHSCGHCGQTFEPVRRWQRFCRPSCRFAHRRRAAPLPLLDDLDDIGLYPFE
jgi:hypothetical protein